MKDRNIDSVMFIENYVQIEIIEIISKVSLMWFLVTLLNLWQAPLLVNFVRFALD